MSTVMYNKIYEFLTTAEERQINATSVIYLGMKENRWFDNAFEGVYTLYDIGAIKTDKEQPLSSDQIEKNINELKRKLGKDTTPLYQHLYSGVSKIPIQELTWKDPLASQVISDKLELKLAHNMTSKPIPLVQDICREFIQDFNRHGRDIRPKLSHDGTWKESEEDISCIVKEVLNVLKDQSVASADRKGEGNSGRRPDIMFVGKYREKIFELIMQSEIEETDSLKICIARLEVENAELKKKFAEIEARNAELKARIAKLEDKQTQNELIKNLLSAHIRECNVFPTSPAIYVTDIGVQINGTWPEALKHDYEEENNRRVINELKVLSQHLVDYNKRTFGKFMEDIEKDYRERVTANKKMRYEIKNLKMQLLEAEKKLASMKSNSSH
ncbi:hypothetical protein C1645_817057 [Glomus cerebriforme]|uniref:Uncharacterized protein n=1 Tax=Glomus cerebriforme TaxID=658196 RepID=A0A397TJM3_9GLOM|nr:hypothetical protein C1645_817057 [Glomus cerebriforme]